VSIRIPWTGCGTQEVSQAVEVPADAPGARRHRIQEYVMPKLKTKRSAAKRFAIRASGSIKRAQAFKRHLLTKKSTKNKRHLRGPVAIHPSDAASVRRMLPYA
jgi:large subunit ribosomal protein L35